MSELDRDTLFGKWCERAAVADVELKQYNQDCNGIPRGVFSEQHKLRAEPIVQEILRGGVFRVGMFRRAIMAGKFESHFRNIFFSGSFLGMIADTAAGHLP